MRRFQVLKAKEEALTEFMGSGETYFVTGVPKTTPRLTDVLEGLTGLRKAVVPVVMVCYSKRVQIKSGKG